ncbi:hypothetical protein Ndes2526B_g07920 [Nannochloris sp. 'desiccata']|nr:hypothetical protein KSW81_002573 [Chlorella desiccata (nom. nud.)]KAH7617315.1 hypothetical protein NADE_007099 [Chlorella desiccata (nom. nud.)]
MNFKALLVALALVAVTKAQADIAFLRDPVYEPFISIVVEKAGICLADPAIVSGKFAVPNCPGLVSIMNDIYNNVTDPAIACERECVSIFDTLNDACFSALRGAFTNGTDAVAKAGTAFYEACDKVGPATSPAATPTTASPDPSPATPSSASPVPSPTPTPAAPSSAAVKSVSQIFFGAVVGAAIMMMLA